MSVWSGWTIWGSLCHAWDLKIGSDITSAEETYVFPPVRAVSERSLPPGLVSAALKRHSAPAVLDLSPIPKESPSSFARRESTSFDGCSPTSRTTRLRACVSTRPGTLISQKRIAFLRRFTQISPNTRRFIAEFRLNGRIMICHQAALAPNNPEGSLPPARSPFMIE